MCGDYDGIKSNDANYLSEQLRTEYSNHGGLLTANDMSVNMDFDAQGASGPSHPEVPFGKTNTGSMAARTSYHTDPRDGAGRYRSIMQCKSGPSAWDVKGHTCFDCAPQTARYHGNTLSGIQTAGPVASTFLETKSTQTSLLSKRGKPCNTTVPTNGKTDITPPGLTQGCARPTVGHQGFQSYSFCSCGNNKFAATVATTTCKPCCPGNPKAKKGATAEGCYDCIQDFCGTGSAMMANTCANAQDADAENSADTETDKEIDASREKSLLHKIAEENKNEKVTELEDEVEVLEAGVAASRRLF
jgi:hypothetical protein